MSTVVCHNCHTKQQIPPAYPSIWCITCRAIIYSPYPLPNPYPPPPHVPWGCSHVPEWVDAPPPPISGRRKAVICGIMYKGKKERLEGCIEDAKFMRCLLMRRFGFSENSIYMLTGGGHDKAARYAHEGAMRRAWAEGMTRRRVRTEGAMTTRVRQQDECHEGGGGRVEEEGMGIGYDEEEGTSMRREDGGGLGRKKLDVQ